MGNAITARLGLDTKEFAAGLDRAKAALSGVAASLGVTAGISAMGIASVKAAADAETMATSFKVLVGDAKLAAQAMENLTAMAAETPFELPELADAGKKLLAFGFNSQQLVPVLTRIGDISSGIGAPIAEIAELYGKAHVQGRLFAEDVNQLTGRGIPIIQELAKQFGVSDDSVKGLVESGAIGFPQLEKAFASLTSEGGKFYGMMKQQSATLNGQLSSLNDAFTGLKVAIGNGMIEPMKNAVQVASSLLEKLTLVANTNPAGVEKLKAESAERRKQLNDMQMEVELRTEAHRLRDAGKEPGADSAEFERQAKAQSDRADDMKRARFHRDDAPSNNKFGPFPDGQNFKSTWGGANSGVDPLVKKQAEEAAKKAQEDLLSQQSITQTDQDNVMLSDDKDEKIQEKRDDAAKKAQSEIYAQSAEDFELEEKAKDLAKERLQSARDQGNAMKQNSIDAMSTVTAKEREAQANAQIEFLQAKIWGNTDQLATADEKRTTELENQNIELEAQVNAIKAAKREQAINRALMTPAERQAEKREEKRRANAERRVDARDQRDKDKPGRRGAEAANRVQAKEAMQALERDPLGKQSKFKEAFKTSETSLANIDRKISQVLGVAL